MSRKKQSIITLTYTIELLDRKHETDQFDCGQEGMNTFLVKHAFKNREVGFGVTYVLVQTGSTRVLGYYTLVAAHMIREESLTFKEQSELPPHDVPIIRLARLAVDASEKGKGLSSYLLMDVLRRAVGWSNEIGIRGVDVHTIDDAAVAFYLKYGFEQLPDASDHLFIAIDTVRQIR